MQFTKKSFRIKDKRILKVTRSIKQRLCCKTSKARSEVGSTAVLQRGTFLVPLPVPSVLFENSTVFDTVGTFLARLPRYSVLLCGMERKSFKRSSNYGEALSNLARVIRSGSG